jgi:hypothetical protein
MAHIACRRIHCVPMHRDMGDMRVAGDTHGLFTASLAASLVKSCSPCASGDTGVGCANIALYSVPDILEWPSPCVG